MKIVSRGVEQYLVMGEDTEKGDCKRVREENCFVEKKN